MWKSKISLLSNKIFQINKTSHTCYIHVNIIRYSIRMKIKRTGIFIPN